MGKQYIETHTNSHDYSRRCTILLANKLAPESELIVTNLVTNRKRWSAWWDSFERNASGHVYGVALLDPSWIYGRSKFPEAEPGKRTVLECSRCLAVKSVSLTEIEWRFSNPNAR